MSILFQLAVPLEPMFVLSTDDKVEFAAFQIAYRVTAAFAV